MSTNKTTIEITALNKTEQTFREIKSQFGNLERTTQTLQGKMSSLSGVFGGMAAGLSVGAFTTWIKGAIDAADEIGKMSQKVGVGVERLSELKYAGELADVTMDQLGTGLKQLSKNMLAAASGGKEQAQVFKDLGVEIKNTDGSLRSADDVFQDVAAKFADMGDGAEKTGTAMKIFGRAGAGLIPMLNAGKEGLAENARQARALGLVFTNEAAVAAEQFNDNLTTLNKGFAGIAIGMVNTVIMPLVSFMKTAMQAQVTWMAFMDKLALVDKFKWSGLIGSQKGELKRQMAIIDEAAFGQINEIEAQFAAKTKSVGAGATGGQVVTPKATSYRAPKTPGEKYDLDEAKRAGGLYEWYETYLAGQELAEYQPQLKAPEIKQPEFGLGFTDVQFQSLEEYSAMAAEALEEQQNGLRETEASLLSLAQRYDEVYGIRIPSATEGAKAAWDEYSRYASDSTNQAFAVVATGLQGLEDAVVDFVTTGKASFADLAKSVLASLARIGAQKLIAGIGSLFGGGKGLDFSWLESAKGNAFVGGNVTAFAGGGVVNAPTLFPMASGLGLMGEAGPEAIMPLARDASGRLGVRSSSQSLAISVPVTVNGNNWDERGLRDEIETVVHKWVGRHS